MPAEDIYVAGPFYPRSFACYPENRDDLQRWDGKTSDPPYEWQKQPDLSLIYEMTWHLAMAKPGGEWVRVPVMRERVSPIEENLKILELPQGDGFYYMRCERDIDCKVHPRECPLNEDGIFTESHSVHGLATPFVLAMPEPGWGLIFGAFLILGLFFHRLRKV